MPPIAKTEMKVSMSNPVVLSRLNNVDGFQYSGTKIGSVNARGNIIKLAKKISRLKFGDIKKKNNQIIKNQIELIKYSYIHKLLLQSILIYENYKG